MSFSICGFVRNSLTSMGIEGIWITLMKPDGKYIQTKTDYEGKYEFINLENEGIYIIYENVEYCYEFPPQKFPQPTGYKSSTSTRVFSIDTVGKDILVGTNFEHLPNTDIDVSSSPCIKISKLPDMYYVAVNDIITYTITCINNGNLNLSNVVISDLLSTEMEYIQKSVIVNNKNAENEDILKGVEIGNLDIGEICTIKFRVKMLIPGNIKNFASATYSYKTGNFNSYKSGCTKSNTTNINVSNINVMLKKYSDKKIVLLGDKIEYNIKIINMGNVDIYNVLLQDKLHRSISLIKDTISIDEKVINGVDLEQGVVIPFIEKGKCVTIKFLVQVSNSCKGNKIVDVAKIKYSYKLPDGSYGEKEVISSNESAINMAISSFKHISIEDYLRIPCQKPEISQINSIKGDIKILNYHTVQTRPNKSIEGQNNTGYKLIFHGVLNIIVSYAAIDTCESVHSSQYEIPFSSFIVLPKDYVLSNKFEIYKEIENISYRVIDSKTFFINVMTLFNAKIISC